MTSQRDMAVFGGGCFWCTEAVFSSLRGVDKALPGYAGGITPNPTYDQVSSGATGYAEVIKIEFEPKIIKFRDLLEIFFATHDPTTMNRQGNDVGDQYRSIIFYTSSAQKKEAEDLIANLNKSGAFDSTIVTKLAPLDKFYEAEEYHRQYFERHPDQAYCQAIINPKMQKFRSKYSSLLK